MLLLSACAENKKAYSGYWCPLEKVEYAMSEEGKNDEHMQSKSVGEADGIMYKAEPALDIKISYDEKLVRAPGAVLQMVGTEKNKIYVRTESGYRGTLLITPVRKDMMELSLTEAEDEFFTEQSWFSPEITDAMHRCDVVEGK